MGIDNGKADPWAVINVWVWQMREACHSHCKQNMLLSEPLGVWGEGGVRVGGGRVLEQQQQRAHHNTNTKQQ